YNVPDGAVVNYYTITSADDVPERDPKHWLFEGSMNGENWVTLDERDDAVFDSRFQKRGFLFDNSETYNYYRFYVLENYGDVATQLQQLEFIGTKDGNVFTSNSSVDNQKSRLQLEAGTYTYTVKDANLNSVKNTVIIGYTEPFAAMGLQVVQKDACSVIIENPDSNYDYYWLSDEMGSEILQIGTDFQPPASGNYYVAAVEPTSKAMSANRKGFAVTLATAPEIETLADNTLSIVNPQTDLDYHWYSSDGCGDPIHIGMSYTPTLGTGTYYAAARKNTLSITPIDPRDIEGMVHRMDASDLDGDGSLDDPAPATSSTLGWGFETGGAWGDGGWFAFRSNYQNGLGIVDFATIWIQGVALEQQPYQTILMAYEENALSFPNAAPFNGLTANIPRHEDESQLFASDAPARTLEGSTFLNGELVNPLTTINPLEFCVLGVRMTEPSDAAISSTNGQWEGKLGELLLWNRDLTDAEMEGVSAYLHQKWVSLADLESPKTAVFWEASTGAETIETVSSIQFFPNPVVDVLEVNNLQKGDVLQLMGLDGKVLKAIEVSGERVVIDLKGLEAGVYLLKVDNFVGKVVKF
ncbi:MAG: T9SS type A sorting domain-containing protein, partial [Chitinophagales bacterium]